MVPSITASHPDPEAAEQPQTITLPPLYLTVTIIFFSIKWCVSLKPDAFLKMWEIVFSLVSSVLFCFCLETLPHMPFLPSHLLVSESWTLTLSVRPVASNVCSSNTNSCNKSDIFWTHSQKICSILYSFVMRALFSYQEKLALSWLCLKLDLTCSCSESLKHPAALYLFSRL